MAASGQEEIREIERNSNRLRQPSLSLTRRPICSSDHGKLAERHSSILPPTILATPCAPGSLPAPPTRGSPYGAFADRLGVLPTPCLSATFATESFLSRTRRAPSCRPTLASRPRPPGERRDGRQRGTKNKLTLERERAQAVA